MRRTEVLQGLRLMKVEDIYEKTHRGELSQSEAAQILGISECADGHIGPDQCKLVLYMRLLRQGLF